MAILFECTEAGDFGSIGDNKVRVTGGTEGTPADFDDFVNTDRANLAELLFDTGTVNMALTYPIRPVEYKALRLKVTPSGGGHSGDETVDIFGTTYMWHKITGASASGQKVVPLANLTAQYQVGDTVILIDISTSTTYETDTIASIQDGVSITMTNNNTNSYATGDVVGIYQTEQLDFTGGYGSLWTVNHYGVLAEIDCNNFGTGGELITNGTFDSDTSSWTAYGATLTQGTYGGRANCMEVADSGGWSSGWQNIVTEIGKLYKVTALVYPKDSVSNGDNGIIKVQLDGTTIAGWGDPNSRGQQDGADTWATHTLIFTATHTATKILLHSNGSYDAYFDDVICVEVDVVKVEQPIWGVIWDNGGGKYQVDSLFDIGDDSTSTYFTSKDGEQIYGSDGCYFRIMGQATLQMGELVNSYSINGVCWNMNVEDRYGYTFGREDSIFKMYDSHLIARNSSLSDFTFFNPTIKESTIEGIGGTSVGYVFLKDTIDISGQVYFVNFRSIRLSSSPTAFDDVHLHHTVNALYVEGAGLEIVLKNLKTTDFSARDVVLTSGNFVDIINPVASFSAIDIGADGSYIRELYDCNIHIADKDGADLASASIDCEYANLVEGSDNKTYKCIQDHTAVDATHLPTTGNDWASYWVLYSDAEDFIKPSWKTGFDYKSGAEEFSTQTTDASGDITEQNVQYKKWKDATEYEEKRLHKFTISKAGYETLATENIMVDTPIVWHLELQPMRARNYARSRIQGVQFQ